MPWPNNFNPYAGVKPGRAADLGDQYYRSMSERNLARWLNWLKAEGYIKDWLYEPMKFVFPKGAGYIPDFCIFCLDDTFVYWERKGFMSAASRNKFNRMAKYYPYVRIAVIDNDAYRRICKEYSPFIPNWEGYRGRVIL